MISLSISAATSRALRFETQIGISFVVRKIQGGFVLFGYLDNKSLVDYYPDDRHKDFQWSSVVGKLGLDDVFNGFPGF